MNNNTLLMLDIYVLKDNNAYVKYDRHNSHISNYYYAFFQFMGIYDNMLCLVAFMGDKQDVWYCDINNFRLNFISIRDWVKKTKIIGDVVLMNNDHLAVRLYTSNDRVLAFDSKDRHFYLLDNNLDYEVRKDNYKIRSGLFKELEKDLKLRRKYF